MAATVLAVNDITRSGVQPASVAADAVNGMVFANNGRVVLEVVNGGASPINVTFTEQQQVDGISTAGRVVACPNGATPTYIGPFPTSIYNDAGGNVDVAFSAATSVTVRALRLP